MDACERHKLIAIDGAVDLNLSGDKIGKTLESALLESQLLEEFHGCKEEVIRTILKSRYKNLFTLLRGNISDETYLGIVRNQVLVDVQVRYSSDLSSRLYCDARAESSCYHVNRVKTCCIRFSPAIYCNGPLVTKPRFWSSFNGFARKTQRAKIVAPKSSRAVADSGKLQQNHAENQCRRVTPSHQNKFFYPKGFVTS